MATKTKKVSVNTIEKIAKENSNLVEKVMWHDIEISVKYRLGLQEMLSFVDGVVKSCFTKDDGTYMPEIRRFAIHSNLIESYTNISLPLNIEKRYGLICYSDIIDLILQHIDRNQFNDMVQSVNEKIEHLAKANVESINRQVSDLVASFGNLQTQFADIFGDIGSGDMQNLLGAIQNGKIDEEKLVTAYMNNSSRFIGDVGGGPVIIKDESSEA